MKDSDLIRVGAAHVLPAIASLKDAALGQCEAFELVSKVDDTHDRCTSMGVKIRETDMRGLVRHRFVCPKHGYDPKHTPPVLKDQL